MKKYFLFLFIVFSILFTQVSYAENISVSGFTPGQIWYSKEPLVEGETVNIHTSIWNGEENSLSVKVEFYDKNVILGSRDIIVKSSELKDVYVPWKITSGDHTISAKIVSSLEVISSDKKEDISLTRSSTSDYKQSVSTTVKNEKGETVDITDSIKTKIDDVTSSVTSLIPEDINNSVSDKFNSIEDLRSDTSIKLDTAKDEAQKELDSIKEVNKENNNTNTKSSIEDVTEKPLAYVKFFLFSILAFIFSNKIVFYGLAVFIVFYIIRLIYRKIRNR